MPEPTISTGALLWAIGPAVARSVGEALGREAIAAWRKERREATASRKALASTAQRFRSLPGAERDLKAWAESPAFDNLLLDAALGKKEALTEARVVQSFVDSGGGAGWGRDRQKRASAITASFLTHLFDELAKGPEGQAFALRLAEARESQARAERAQIDDTTKATRAAAEEAAANTRDFGGRFDGLEEKLASLAPDGRIPELLASAVQGGVFDEISRLFTEGKAAEVLSFADRLADRVEKAIQEDEEGRYTEALQPYRQRLLFGAANAASYLLDTETARARAQAALALGPVDARLHRQAIQATFNAKLPDELRRLVSQLSPDTQERSRANALLAFLDGDWNSAADQLATLGDPALLGLRAEVEVARVDPTDPDRVRATVDLLDRVEEEVEEPADTLAVARASLHLLHRVLQGPTPVDFERRLLVDAVRRRSVAAVETAPPGSILRAHAASTLHETGLILSDGSLLDRSCHELKALPEEVRSHVVFALDRVPTPEEIAAEIDAGRLSPAQAALRTAQLQLDTKDRPAAMATLREGLFQTLDARERVRLLEALVEILRAEGKDADADALLAATPIPEADRWRLAQRDDQPLDLAAAEAFSLNPHVLRLVASRLLDDTKPLGRDHEKVILRPAHPASLEIDEDARPSDWTRRLVVALPSRSSRSLHAEALLHDGKFEELLATISQLDPVRAYRPAELKAIALQGLGRPSEAARVLTEAAEAFPNDERVSLNASAIWLELGRGEEAIPLLKPFIESGTDNVGILLHYATAIRQVDPAEPEAASIAFDLLGRAFEIKPSKKLARLAMLAAQVAGRVAEAGVYFRAMTADARLIDIQSAEDAERALTELHGDDCVAFTGDVRQFAKVMTEKMRVGREVTEALNRDASAHALAAVDTFRASGHTWQNWSRWTLDAQRRPGGARYAVLTDWPSSSHVFGRRLNPAPSGIFADLTALLTLGVLGSDDAATLLAAAAPVYVATGTLDRLQGELLDLQNDLALGGTVGDAEVVDRFKGSDAVIAYDEAIEAAAPDAPDLAACRVDLGVAILLEGLYVTDLDRSLPEGVHARVVTSATLLHTLHLEGRIERVDADRAAGDHPGTFGGWAETPPLDSIPAVLVLDRVALSAWAASGLIDKIETSVRIGPSAWNHVLSDARQKEAGRLAYQRLRATLGVLRQAAEAGRVRDLDPVEAPLDNVAEDSLEGPWRGALQSVRTAQAHRLQLWADDRFYPLLLWQGGPVIESPATEAIRASLAEAGELPLPVPTIDLAARLARDGALPEREARRLAGFLFDQGYRPAHPLALADALDRFPPPDGGTLRGRFLALADAVRAIPDYLPDSIPQAKRHGFARVAAAEVAEQFVLQAWTHPGLTEVQRRTLADAFLEAAESVFASHSPNPDVARGDRTHLFFWRGLSSSLFTTSFVGEDAVERQDAALRWLGDAAAQRPDPYHDIVRLLEDNASVAVQLTPGVEEIAAVLQAKGEDGVDPHRIHAGTVGQFAFRALVPLLGSGLIEHLDPLLRRTVGILARLDRGGRIDANFGVLYEGQELTTTVSEEEEEEAAIGLIIRVLQGDQTLVSCVRATDLCFGYNRPPPEAWVTAGFSEDAHVPIEVQISFFALLWGDHLDMQPYVISQLVYHLAGLDPPLALSLVEVAEELLSDDASARNDARNALALKLLQSGFYELQRDLGHGLWRIRDWPAERLSRFLGWLGSDAASRLVDVDPLVASQIVTIGDAIISQSHFLGRKLLAQQFDDAPQVLAAIAGTVAGETTPPIPDLPAWLAHRREAAETADDPFVAAYALRHVLLALREGVQDDATVFWVQSYLAMALSDLDPSVSGLARHLNLRRRLARSSLQLAAFATYGRHHLEAYNAKSDPLAEWLDRTWLLTSRLILALPALHGDLASAASEAERAARDLGVDTPSALVQDMFDPFVFAEADDIGRTLILAALHKSLDPAAEAPPLWWSDDIRARLNEIAERSLSTTGSHTPILGDRLGIGAPLREGELALMVLNTIDRRSS